MTHLNIAVIEIGFFLPLGKVTEARVYRNMEAGCG